MVWAPFAQKVCLLTQREFEWDEHPMEGDADGFWSTTHPDTQAGQAYKYRITTKDGQKIDRNDPYARQLTDSDQGSSVIVANDFDWGDVAENFTAAPLNQAIIYELHIGTFNKPDASTNGTFASTAEKLWYLQELGITHVEIMPVTSMAASYGWGYAPNHIFSIENAYGGRHGLLTFVKACHELGIGVIVDVVYNHFFSETDLWQYDGWSENDRGGIYFYNDERGDTPWGGRPDYGRSEVRKFILDNVTMWFTEFKIDGLRVDSTIFLRNTIGANNDPAHDIPDAWSLMQEITTLARKINPNAIMIAEDNASTPEIVMPVKEGGMGFDAQWEVGFPHVIRDAIGITKNENQAPLQGVAWELERTYNGSAFDKVIFADSHDTAANGGARLNEAATPGNAESLSARHRVLLASALTLTAPGVPMLLQGQEFMQEGSFNDWQRLEWGKTEQFAGIVLAHQHLIDLRRNRYGNTGGLLGNTTELIHRDDKNAVLAFRRVNQGGVGDDTVVIINFSDKTLKDYELTLPTVDSWRVRFNSSWKGYNVDFHETHVSKVRPNEERRGSLELAPFNVLILSIDELAK